MNKKKTHNNKLLALKLQLVFKRSRKWVFNLTYRARAPCTARDCVKISNKLFSHAKRILMFLLWNNWADEARAANGRAGSR